MDSDLNKLLREALEDQKEIFGDLLFSPTNISSDGYESQNIKVTERLEMEIGNSLFIEEYQKAETIEELNSIIKECQKCPLGKTRNKFVYGVGNPKADAMLIGEAPGADEDAQGEPFVGRAGKLLNDILKAISLERNEVYIANILKCRPPR